MTAKEYSQRVGLFLNEFQSTYPVINARLSLSALNLIRARIINEGVDHIGKTFGKYSQNKLPYFFFKDKALSKGAETKFEAYKKKKSKLPPEEQAISYEEWRRINGLQTKHVDMSFSKETLNDLDVIETSVGKGIITTVVASKNSITKKNGGHPVTTGQVTEYLGERYGNFLQLSEKEEELIAKALDYELQQTIDKLFND